MLCSHLALTGGACGFGCKTGSMVCISEGKRSVGCAIGTALVMVGIWFRAEAAVGVATGAGVGADTGAVCWTTVIVAGAAGLGTAVFTTGCIACNFGGSTIPLCGRSGSACSVAVEFPMIGSIVVGSALPAF